MRLLTGLLAGQAGRFELVGDESLSRRPMERSRSRCARWAPRRDDRRPRAARDRGRPLTPIAYELPVASAQVKSAILLAGLYADGGRRPSIEPLPTRDHTERMLARRGARVTAQPTRVDGRAGDAPRARARSTCPATSRPRRRSSSPPTLLAGSELSVHGVSINPRRTGLLDVLERMGARVALFNRRQRRRRARRRPRGALGAARRRRRSSREEVPLLVDELPLFALARRARPRREHRARRGGAAREGDRPDRGRRRRRCARSACASGATADGFAVRGVPARPRGGAIDAAAITGSRCSARSPGSSRGGRRARGRRSGGDELPRVLRPARIAASDEHHDR